MKTAEWRGAWEESHLPSRHKRVLSAIAHSMGANGGADGRCYVGAKRIAMRAGFDHERTVRRILKDLRGNWLTVEDRPGRTARLYARLPDRDWVPPPEHWPRWDTPGSRAQGRGDTGSVTPGSSARTPRAPAPAEIEKIGTSGEDRIGDTGLASDRHRTLSVAQAGPEQVLQPDKCRRHGQMRWSKADRIWLCDPCMTERSRRELERQRNARTSEEISAEIERRFPNPETTDLEGVHG